MAGFRRGVLLPLFVVAAGVDHVLSSETYPEWRYRARIDFPAYVRDEVLTNFPVLVSVSTNIAGFSFSQLKTPDTGGDLRFTAEDKVTPLNFEIEKWDASNKTGLVWVQVPRLTSNTCIWAFWGAFSDTNLPVCDTNGALWDASYRGVWHMGSAADARDSTSNRNDGTSVNNTNVAGIVGGGQGFNGANASIIVADTNNTLDITNAMTYSAWINLSTLAPYSMLITKNPSGTGANNYPGNYEVRFGNRNGMIEFGYQYNESNGLVFCSSTAALTNDNWYHVALSVQGGGSLNYYFNGELGGTASILSSFGVTNDNPLRIGLRADSFGYFPGRMDEVRIESVARSSNWVWACYLNQVSNNLFNAWGPIVEYLSGTVIVVR